MKGKNNEKFNKGLLNEKNQETQIRRIIKRPITT